MTADPLLMKVLLADDDEDDRWFFLDFLRDRKDVELLTAVTNGIEVIGYLDSIPQQADLPNFVVLDHNMPKLNGRETLSRIRSECRYNCISVIIYSTYTDQQLIDDCILLGAASVRVKPFSSEGYNKMLDEILVTKLHSSGCHE